MSAVRPNIIRRREWMTDNQPQERRGQPGVGVILHHSAGANRVVAQSVSVPQFTALERAQAFKVIRGIREYHVEKMKWSDIGYNFFISRGGLILEARRGSLYAAASDEQMVVAGAHAGPVANRIWWGVCVEGNTSTGQPTAHQMESVYALCAWLLRGTRLQSDAIKGHRQFKATECPGSWLSARLGEIKAEVKRRKIEAMG